jgi:hypothetical protein
MSQHPRCKQRGIKLVALQAAGLLTLAAFAKWMLAHPLGSLPAGINTVISLAWKYHEEI